MTLFAWTALTWLAQSADDKIEFKFDRAGLSDVLDLLSRKTGFVFVRDPSIALSGVVSAVSGRPITRDETLDVLNSALRFHSLIAVRVEGNVVEIIRLPSHPRRHPIFVGADPDKVPDAARLITQVVPLQGLSIAEFEEGLQSLLPPTLSVARDHANNTLVLTGPASDIRHVLKLLRGLAPGVPTLDLIPLMNANAAATAKILNDLFRDNPIGPPVRQILRKTAALPADATTLRIVADDSANAILVLGSVTQIRVIREFAERLDRLQPGETRLQHFRLRRASAPDLAAYLMTLFKPADSPSDELRLLRRVLPDLRALDPGPTAPIRAVADRASNSLIVAAPEGRMKLIAKLVEDFDRMVDERRRTQVFELKNAGPAEVAAVLRQIFPTIDAAAINSSLIVRGDEADWPFITDLIKTLDAVPLQVVEVIELKNRPAQSVQEMIRSVFNGEPGAPKR